MENIKIIRGDIFESDADLITNPVNCVGVMGGGLARKFANKFPTEYLDQYKASCDNRSLKIGHPKYWTISKKDNKYICNFPTKNHFRDPSELGWIAYGLVNLVLDIQKSPVINSVAIPALGCGLGNLSWNDVLICVKMAAALDENIKWQIYLDK